MKTSMIMRMLAFAVLFGGIALHQGIAGESGEVKKGERTITISVPEMQCGMCEAKIEKALKKIAGVKSVDADAEANTVTVTYNTKKTSRSNLEQAIADVGYDAGKKKAKATAQAELPGCCKPGGHE